MNKRLKEIDIAKGIGIILTIIGHRTSGNIQSFIYTFHMPLFFILSGFFLDSKKDNNKLLSSYIMYSFIFLFLRVFFFEIDESLIYIILGKCIQTISFFGIHVLWFLSSLWLSKIILQKLLSKYHLKTCSIIVFLPI